ncbi:hypothetical protein JW826_02155 [Candidatus Woesearchaeota archaeon]|nr:hypothetical protein [Candidatus Woesearchaeota archaeon]
MKNNLIFGIILVALISLTGLAQAAELKDTSIDHMNYREILPGDTSIIYKISLRNTGNHTRTYEIEPNTDAVKQVGIYMIYPSSKVQLKKGEKATAEFRLTLEKETPSRIEIPVKITSEGDSTEITLAARQMSPLDNAKSGKNIFSDLLKIMFFTLIVIIFLILIIRLFKKKKKEDDSPEVETYY